jgi:Leucine-rich repeat (LRR) protein
MDQIRSMILYSKIEGLIIEVNGKDILEFDGDIQDIIELSILYIGGEITELNSSIIKGMKNLKNLSLQKVYFSSYEGFRSLSKIEYLEIAYSKLEKIPDEFEEMTLLEDLTIRRSNLSTIDWSWGKLDQLTSINLESNAIKTVPSSFYWHKNLESVSFANNPIKTIDFIGDNNLSKLTHLYLDSTKLRNFPLPIDRLNALKVLYLYGSEFSEIPTEVLKLANLKELYFSENNLSDYEEIPSIKNRSITYLDLSYCELDKIPRWILSFEGVFELLLNNNNINKLPIWLNELPVLKCIHLQQTLITTSQIKIFKDKYSDKDWMIRI